MIDPELIQTAIDDYYLTRPSENDFSLPIRPSAFGGCPRRVAHLMAGVKPGPNAASLERLFELGHQRGIALHKAIEFSFVSAGYTVYAEQPVWVPLPIVGEFAYELLDKVQSRWPMERKGRYPMTVQTPLSGSRQEATLVVIGHIDSLIIGSPGHRYIIDYKTASSFGFGLLDSEGPKEDNTIQILAYDAGCAWSGTPAKKLFLVYEAKDADARKGHAGGDLKVIEVEKNGRNLSLYNKAIHNMADALIRGIEGQPELVPEPYPIGGKTGKAKALPWQCNYCSLGPIAGTCYGGELENRGDERKPKWYLEQFSDDDRENLVQERIEADHDNFYK